MNKTLRNARVCVLDEFTDDVLDDALFHADVPRRVGVGECDVLQAAAAPVALPDELDVFALDARIGAELVEDGAHGEVGVHFDARLVEVGRVPELDVLHPVVVACAVLTGRGRGWGPAVFGLDVLARRAVRAHVLARHLVDDFAGRRARAEQERVGEAVLRAGAGFRFWRWGERRGCERRGWRGRTQVVGSGHGLVAEQVHVVDVGVLQRVTGRHAIVRDLDRFGT